jgi:hypothetical protein
MRNSRKSLLGPKILLAGFLFFILNRACSPPSIDKGINEEIVTIDRIFEDVRNSIDKPVRFSGKVVSSFFVGSLGGYYFLEDPHNQRTILCLTRNLPPRDGITVSVLGIVKPLLCKGDFNLLYFKTKEVELEYPLFSDFASLP